MENINNQKIRSRVGRSYNRFAIWSIISTIPFVLPMFLATITLIVGLDTFSIIDGVLDTVFGAMPTSFEVAYTVVFALLPLVLAIVGMVQIKKSYGIEKGIGLCVLSIVLTIFGPVGFFIIFAMALSAIGGMW